MEQLEQRLKTGDMSAFGELFSMHRQRLWQMIHFRINNQIRGRVDPDDVVQEVYIAAEKRLKYFIEGDFPTLFLWLRLVTGQVLSDLHRTHLGTEARSVLRESNPSPDNLWRNTSVCLSQRFVAHLTSASQAVVRSELITEVREALESMNDIDREVVALRHFEELTNQEVAIALNISPKASSVRYIRALQRLKSVLEKI